MSSSTEPDRRTVLVRGARAAGIAALFGGAGNLLAGCGGGDTGGGQTPQGPVRGGRLRYAVNADIGGFDPVNDSFPAQAYTMGGTIMESLVAVDASGKWRPFLAESIEPNDDHTQWTITLREGVTFSTGEPLTADVVEANLNAQRQSPLNALTLQPVESVKAKDDRTVVVGLNMPWVPFPYYLAVDIGMMIPLSSLKNPDQATRKPVGTGPFVYKEYVRGSRFVVAKNPNYWRKGFPYLDEIEFRIIPDPQTKSQTLESGGVDAMMSWSDEDFAKYLDMGEQFAVFRPEGMSVPEYYWMLNTATPPLDDVRVRRALAYATNQKQYVQALRSGLTKPADSPWTKDTQWYAENGYPTYDLAKAKALVREYEAEMGPIRISLLTIPSQSSVQNATLAQDHWRAAGIDVRIEKADQPTLIDRALHGDFQAVGWLFFSSSDPDEAFSILHSKYAAPIGSPSPNASRIKDTAMDEALVAGRISPEESARKEAYATVQQRLGELVPYIWMDHLSAIGVIAGGTVHDVTSYALPSGEKGMPMTYMNHPFAQIWIEQ